MRLCRKVGIRIVLSQRELLSKTDSAHSERKLKESIDRQPRVIVPSDKAMTKGAHVRKTREEQKEATVYGCMQKIRFDPSEDFA